MKDKTSILSILYHCGHREIYKIVFDGVDYELFFFRELRSGHKTKPMSEMKVQDVGLIKDYIGENAFPIPEVNASIWKVEAKGDFFTNYLRERNPNGVFFKLKGEY